MTTNNRLPGQASSYLDYLPAIFQQDVEVGRPNFLGRFLLAFEKVLTGLGDAKAPGLEEKLDGIRDSESDDKWLLAGVHRYFDPGPGPRDDLQRAPLEFLEWLAGWVALDLRADLDELRQRDFIARAAKLYRLRGTKQGLEEAIRIYTRLAPTVDELNTTFQIGVHSTIGVDTLLEGGAPHFFKVTIRLPAPDPEQRRQMTEVATAIIDMEKPAHTHYVLEVETPILQIGVHSTIGVDTLLGPSLS